MKNLILYIVLCILIVMIKLPDAFAQLPSDDPSWQLVFEEQFDVLTYDSSEFWIYDYKVDKYCVPAVYPSQDYYFISHYNTSPFNTIFDTTGTGKLTLKVRHEVPSVTRYVENVCTNTWDSVQFAFTSPAGIVSRDEMRYGYFEIRSRLPYLDVNHGALGIGPAFWMFQNNDTLCWSEIDIYEFKENQMITCAVHYQDTLCDVDNTDTYHYCEASDTLFSVNDTLFHLYSAEWTPEYIKFYKDNNEIWTSTNHPDSLIPMFMLITIATPVGGVSPDTMGSPQTLFPYDYIIDYVRVYQLKEYCDSNFTVCNQNFTNYDRAIYKTISIGGSGCSSVVQNGINLTLRATDSVELKSGFEVSLGATLTIDISPCPNSVYLIDPPGREIGDMSSYLLKKFFGQL
ncbi:MAG: glycoside hydrolase family 16 protein [Bacteroidota bacterium]